MKKHPPKRPKNIRKSKINPIIPKIAFIMRVSFVQLEMIKATPFENPAQKAIKTAIHVLNTAEAINKMFSKKQQYLNRINKNK